MPIAYIQRTRERYAQYSPLTWVVNHDAPWTPLAKPLRDCGYTTTGIETMTPTVIRTASSRSIGSGNSRARA